MSTTPATPDAESRPAGDPRAEAPNGGAPAVTADAIARRDAARAKRSTHADRRASRF